MTTSDSVFFGIMVFIAIVTLAAALIVPTAGTAAQASRKMRGRIFQHLEAQGDGVVSLVREQYLGQLSPFERNIEKLPLLQPLSRVVEQSGEKQSVARILFKSTLFGVIAGTLVYLFYPVIPVALLIAAIVFAIPIISLIRKRNARTVRFEEQLPEALDMMSTALKAGHPFTETLNLVSEEMQDPIAGEFGRVFSDLNFGMSQKAALQAMLIRMPSMSLHTLITAVIIQTETGGALAEIIENVADVIRGRFKLQRKIRSLSAEGRMSAWVLALIPFALALLLMVASPDYLPVLLTEPLGRKLILIAFGLMIVGSLWMRKIIRIEV